MLLYLSLIPKISQTSLKRILMIGQKRLETMMGIIQWVKLGVELPRIPLTQIAIKD